MKKYLGIILIFVTIQSFGQSERKYIRSGNKLYENKKFVESENAYRKALNEKSNSLEAGYNIGNSLYQQGKYEDATKQFLSMTELTKDKEQLSKIYYNLGNSYFKSNKLQESANAYKNALRNNPDDNDAKYNLSLVQKMMRQQQNQQNKDQNKDNKDNKDKKDQNKDNKDNKDQNKQDQDKKDQQNKDNQDKQDKKDQQNKQNQQDKDQQNKDQQGGQEQKDQPKDQQGQISAGDAERILEAMKNDEKQVQQKLQLIKAKEEKDKKARQKNNPTKNW